MSLPGADELFRGTPNAPAAQPEVPLDPVPTEPEGKRRGSGRVKHDQKMTVYVTEDELLELEHARLTLRRELGLPLDRGRLVREALALVLADLDQHGADSDLARRLREA